MRHIRHETCAAPENALKEAPQGINTPSDDLGLLTSGLGALCKAHEEPLNEIERKAIMGMLAYVAYTQKVGEEIVAEVMTSHFKADTVAALPSRLYQNAIEYLLDLKIDKIMN